MTASLSSTRTSEPQRAEVAVQIVSAESRTLVALTFAVKTFAAALLALFVSFWLTLDEPYWALLTVFVVAQPDSGLVLAKGFYRILGTAAGLLITVALVFALAQYGELFIALLAAWIGLCNFASRAARNFASYGFQLAGYTVAIVGIPAALNPGGAYPIILARATEISLGIGCMALVSRLMGPRELAPKLFALVRELMRRADRFARAAMDLAVDREQLAAERARFAKDFGTVEAMRSSAFFESADLRLLNEPLRQVTHAAVDLYAVADEATARLGSAAHAASPQDPGASITNTNDTPRENAEVVSALLSAADRRSVARARVRLCEAEAALDSGKRVAGPSPAGWLWSDPMAAALTGIRAALAVAITAVFWLATAWPSGPTAVIVAGIVCTLLASTEQPEKITLALAATILVAAVPVFVTQFYLLPYALDFVSMAAVLAPLLLGCGLIIAQPGMGPLGLLSAVYFAVASHIDNSNVMTYDVVGFLNTSVAIFVGIAVALVLFATFFPETPVRAGRQFRRQLSVQLSLLTAVRHPPLQAFQFALCEQLATTLARVKDEPTLARECLASGVTALSTARAIDGLRIAIGADRLPPEMVASISSLLGHISRACLHPCRASLTKSAWEARVLRCRSLAMARAASDAEETEALAAVLVGCEALRFDLRKALRAAVNGFVTNLNLAKGTYASPSKPVLALIDSDSYRVDAYFEETKIPQIRASSAVDIRLMNGAATLQGRVESIARGITDYDNHDGPELLANVNPTFTWVRLAQRIPVRIRLTDVPADVLISAGMTCTVVLKEGVEPHVGAGIKRLIAAIFELIERGSQRV